MKALLIIGAVCLINLCILVYLYIRVIKAEQWKQVEKPIKEDDFINFS